MRVYSVLLALLCSAVLAFGQDSFTLRVDVDLVTLDVGVTDAAGRPVITLAKEDFEVFEDGQPQEILSFASVESPYNVLLLFDCSGSTQPNWPFLVDAMNRFIARLRPQDSVQIAQFGGKFKKLLDWSSRTDRPLDIRVETDDNSCAGTDFYGSLDRSLDELKRRSGRKGVVVLTDGVHDRLPYQSRGLSSTGIRVVDAVEDREFQRILRSVRDSDVAFYFVAIDTDLNPSGSGPQVRIPSTGLLVPAGGYNPLAIYNMQQVRSRMEQLAAESGGRVGFPKNPQDVIPLFEQIGQELGTSYGLGYTPENKAKDGRYRKIEVRVRDRSYTVRQSRDGYEAR